MKRVMICFVGLVMLYLAPRDVYAQTARDTTFVTKSRADLDSIARDKTAPQYSKRAQTRLRARMDSLLRGAPTPPPDTVVTPNQPPTARNVVVCADLTLICTSDASASTDDGGLANLTVTTTWGDGQSSTGVKPSHQFATPGTYNVQVTVTDRGGLSDRAGRIVTVGVPAPDSVVPPVDTATPPPLPPPPADTTQSIALPAALPRSVPSFTIPAPTRVVNVGAGMSLQAAIDNAQRGDEILLTGTFTGTFSLRSCGAGWITIRGAATLPNVGTRVTPTTATGFAKIVTPNNEPALWAQPGSCRWAVVGVEIVGQLQDMNQQAYGIVRLGGTGSEGFRTLADVPTDILVQHSYVHGLPGHNDTRCIALNSANSIVRDSWISDCHAKGSDSQAIVGWAGPGPYLIENNYLEAAGENVMFGGGDPSISGLSPSDITIRRNHFNKPLAWKALAWSVKNLFELKNARRVLLEANVFEHSWASAQEGFAIIFKSSQDACGSCLWEGTQDVTMRWNIVRDAAVGLNLLGVDAAGPLPTNVHTERVTVTDNLFEQIGAEGRAALLLLIGDFKDFRLYRNTFTHAGAPTARGSIAIAQAYEAAKRMDIRGNVFTFGEYGYFHNEGYNGTAGLNKTSGVGGWTFTGNVLVGGAQYSAQYPPGNTFPATVPTTGGVDRAELSRRTVGVVVTP